MSTNSLPTIRWGAAAAGATAGTAAMLIGWWSASQTTGVSLMAVHGTVPALFLVDTLPLWGAMAGHAVVDSLRTHAHRALMRAEAAEGLAGERILETVAGITGDGVLIFEKDGRITQANGAAVSLLGGAMRKLVGSQIRECFPDIDNRSPDMRVLRRSTRGEVLSVEWRMVANRLDGSGSFSALVSGAPVPKSDDTVLIVREVTAKSTKNVSNAQWTDALFASMRWLSEAGYRKSAVQADLRMLPVLVAGAPSVALQSVSLWELVETAVSECRRFADARDVRVVSEVGMTSIRADSNLLIHSMRNVLLELIAHASAGSVVHIENSTGSGLVIFARDCDADADLMVQRLRTQPRVTDDHWQDRKPTFALPIAGELARTTGAHWNAKSDGDGVCVTLELRSPGSETLSPEM